MPSLHPGFPSTDAKLNLRDFNISAAAGLALGGLLRRCPGLTEVDFEHNPELFTPEGLAGLLEGLGEAANLPNLVKLSLPGLKIRAAAALALGGLLRRCPGLTEVNFEGNPGLFTPEGQAFGVRRVDRWRGSTLCGRKSRTAESRTGRGGGVENQKTRGDRRPEPGPEKWRTG